MKHFETYSLRIATKKEHDTFVRMLDIIFDIYSHEPKIHRMAEEILTELKTLGKIK